ncbi:chloride channel protein [bacterium]|nr:chloride channel protein [candidate division CSSED10-310 bacterium]
MTHYLNKYFFKTIDYLKIHPNTYIIFLSLFIGLLGGYGAIGFRYLIDLVQGLSIGHGEAIITQLMSKSCLYKITLPAVGGLIVGPLIYFFAREAKGHGVPEVMEAVALRGGRIRPRVVIIKSIASAITLGTGGSVGREGPIVQIGSAIGSSIGQLLHLSQQRIKTLVACGAAAGIAATFNAPIAGVLFAVEIILGNFAIHTFSPIVVSSVIATVITHKHLGNAPAFVKVPEYMLKSAWELPLYLLLGIIIAFIGLLFMKSIHSMEDFFNKLKMPEYLKTSVGMLILGAVICIFPHIYGNGYETISLTLSISKTEAEAIIINDSNHLSSADLLPNAAAAETSPPIPMPENKHKAVPISFLILLALIPIKIFSTSLTLGAGGSGGIFAPSLFIGSVSGASFGIGVNYLLGLFFHSSFSVESSAYALVGMAAMVGCVTHAPVTAIIILFELTGDYQIVVPLMFSCIIATMITSSLNKDSIYTAKLTRRGVDLNIGLESTIMKRNTVRDIMHINIPTIDPDMPFDSLFNHVINQKYDHYYVVGLDGIYLGEICIHKLSQVMRRDGIQSRLRAIDVMNKSYPKVGPDESLMECVRIFGISGVEELPVIDPADGQFLGIINYRDIFNLYNREVLRQGSLGLKFVSRTEETPRSDYVNIPENYQVELLPVVGNLVGKSIKEADLRGQYSISIVAIRPPHGRDITTEIPSPDRVLTRQDVLIVIGKRKDIIRLRKDVME